LEKSHFFLYPKRGRRPKTEGGGKSVYLDGGKIKDWLIILDAEKGGGN